MDNRDAIGQSHRLGLVVCHVKHGKLELLLQRADLQTHLLAELGIEIGKRFVQQQNRGRVNERRRQRDALLLPSGQFRCAAGFKSLQADDRQSFRHSLPDNRCAFTAHPKRKGDVFENGQVRPDRVGLKHHSHLPLFRSDKQPALRRCHEFFVDRNFTFVGFFQRSVLAWSFCRIPTARAK